MNDNDNVCLIDLEIIPYLLTDRYNFSSFLI